MPTWSLLAKSFRGPALWGSDGKHSSQRNQANKQKDCSINSDLIKMLLACVQNLHLLGSGHMTGTQQWEACASGLFYSPALSSVPSSSQCDMCTNISPPGVNISECYLNRGGHYPAQDGVGFRRISCQFLIFFFEVIRSFNVSTSTFPAQTSGSGLSHDVPGNEGRTHPATQNKLRWENGVGAQSPIPR